MIAISVLDQAPRRTGGAPGHALGDSLTLARHVDGLGYHRFWVAEHHAFAAVSIAAPEVMIGHIASQTMNLRVGSGGVLLPNRRPLHVAEQFCTLEALHPGRIDLGIGRAPGSDRRTAMALAHGPGALTIEQFPAQVRDVILWLHDRMEPGHPFAGIRAMPVGPSAPEVWLLGSSADSATYAAHFGTAFSFAHFINANSGDEITGMYRAYFRPSEWLAEPKVSITTIAL